MTDIHLVFTMNTEDVNSDKIELTKRTVSVCLCLESESVINDQDNNKQVDCLHDRIS